MPKLFQLNSTSNQPEGKRGHRWSPVQPPPGLRTQNAFKELQNHEEEEEGEDEVPMMSIENYPEVGSNGKVECPTQTYTRMPKKGQVDRKALSKAFNKAKKEQEMKECMCRGCDGYLQPLIRDQEENRPELHPLDGTERWMARCEQTGFTKIKSVLDSGATDSCAPDTMCIEVRSKASEGSRRGQMYTAAGGKKLANEGEKDICMVTGDGHAVMTNWQTVDITRPLSSVRQICMQGNRVVFGAQGGVIQHLESGKETHFGVEDNVYVLDLWLPPSQPVAGFTRHP